METDYTFEPDIETAKLFADETRRRIIKTIAEKGEDTNTHIAKALGISKPTVSYHLKMLADAGILEVCRTQMEAHGIPMKFYRLKRKLLPFNVDEDESRKVVAQIKKELFNIFSEGKNRDMGSKVNNALLRLLKSTTSLPGPQLESVLYELGYDVGKKVLPQWLRSHNVEELLREMSQFWDACGMGKIKVIETGEKVRIRIFECYDCMDLPNIGETYCYLDAGIFAGIFDSAFKKPFVARETKCYGTGYEFCEFEIMKKHKK
jgi:hypothetical protein